MRCVPTVGTLNKIAFIGEAPGKDEVLAGKPFIGYSGQELNRMLKRAGIERSECYLTNVFLDRPPNNALEQWCVSKKEVKALDPDYNLPPISSGKYIRPEFVGELHRVREEISRIQPNVICALGNTACWAFLGQTGIGKLRGTLQQSEWGKVIPTYHPAAVTRQWNLRATTLFDLIKVKDESEYPELRLPHRKIYVPETGQECWDFWYVNKTDQIVVDTETKKGTIEIFGIATNPEVAMVIDLHYIADELTAWEFIHYILNNPHITKVYQNCMYDLQYQWKAHGIPTAGEIEDTMLIHHALYPELPKSLGFLGSIYTKETTWKGMRSKGIDTSKRED